MRARIASLAAEAILWASVACIALAAVWFAGAVLDTIGRAAQ